MSGAAGGLGAAIVQRLTADGFSVATCDLVPAACSPALHGEFDVTDRRAVGAFVARTQAELGPPEVVVTAAGVQRTGDSEAVEDEDWKHVLDVNLTGTWNVIQAALAGMLDRGAGRIVTISSEIGLAGLERYAAYAAPRAASSRSPRRWRASSPRAASASTASRRARSRPACC